MQEKKMSRSNSFVANALKWFPLHYSNSQSSTPTLKQFGSTVAVQKLRESKWFGPDEKRIFCAVVECGFIVEVNKNTNLLKTNRLRYNSKEDDEDVDTDDYECDSNIDNLCEPEGLSRLNSISSCGSNDIATDKKDSWFGVVICKTNKDNKPKSETIEIFSVKIRENGVRVFKLTLEDIWKNNWKIRINNFADREKQSHNEKDIRNQISFARKTKCSLWHNTKHFAYWCRYGNRQQDIRRRQMSECVKWGSVGMNAGMLLVMNNNKSRSFSTSK